MQKIVWKKWMAGAAGVLIAVTGLGLWETGLRADAQTGGFSIRAIIPDNQLDKRQTYFDLRMKPGEEQTVQIVITNSRPEAFVAQVQLNAASTARDGLIVFTEPNVRDTGMEISVTDVAAIRTQRVAVPAQGSQTVDIHLKMPNTPFDGVILGGITVTAEEDAAENPETQGVSIQNIITYVVALKLTQTDNEVKPDFELAAITPSLVNRKTAVTVTLRNKAARIVKDMNVQAQIYPKGSDSVLYEMAHSEAEMAPLSTGDFVIDWNGEALRPGTYRLKMSAGYAGKRWEWEEEFIIAGEADELNKGAVGLKKDGRWLYWLLALAALLLVWMIAYRMGKRKKNEE